MHKTLNTFKATGHYHDEYKSQAANKEFTTDSNSSDDSI